jgi:hypothetical protein
MLLHDARSLSTARQPTNTTRVHALRLNKWLELIAAYTCQARDSGLLHLVSSIHARADAKRLKTR